jgi:uncharacterized protein YpuA (DUF1002 family)
MGKRCLSFLLLLAVVLPMVAVAQQEQENNVEKRIRRVQHELHIYALVQQLQLNQKQVYQLLQVCREMQKENLAFLQEAAAHQVAFAKALRRFRTEVAADKGLSSEVEGETARLAHQEKELKKNFCLMVNGYERKAADILTSQQRIIAEYYTPQINYDAHRRTGDLRGLLKQVRDMDEEKFQEQEARMAGQYLRNLEQEAKKHGKAQAMPLPSVEDVRRVLRQVRSLSDSQLEERLDELIEELLPRSPVRKARKELQEIHEEVHGDIGKIGKFLLSPCAIPYYERILSK